MRTSAVVGAAALPVGGPDTAVVTRWSAGCAVLFARSMVYLVLFLSAPLLAVQYLVRTWYIP